MNDIEKILTGGGMVFKKKPATKIPATRKSNILTF